MNTKSLVRSECCNFISGQCIDKPCIVLQGKRCSWFESAIVPLATGGREDAQEIAQGVGEYQSTHKVGVDASTRYCECGAKLAPRKRFCPACAKARRRESERRSRRAG